jgi:hypothetical protein
MINPYTKAAALRIIQNFAKIVEAVRILKNGCIQVTYITKNTIGRASTFLSSKAFIAITSATRSTAAQDIEIVERHGNEFTAYSHKSGNYYIVRPQHPDRHQRCECADTKFRGEKCKHQTALSDRIMERAKKRLAVMPEEFACVPLILQEEPKKCETYYKTHRIQIWKLDAQQWGNFGHLILVDTKLDIIVGQIGNWGGKWGSCWDEIKSKRDRYIDFITKLNGQIILEFQPANSFE